jgi:hypothetical protein
MTVLVKDCQRALVDESGKKLQIVGGSWLATHYSKKMLLIPVALQQAVRNRNWLSLT